MSSLKNQLSMLDDLKASGYASLTDSGQKRIAKQARDLLGDASEDIKKRAGFEPEIPELEATPSLGTDLSAPDVTEPSVVEPEASESELSFVGGITQGLGEQTSATLGQTFISPLVGYNKLGYHGAESKKFRLQTRRQEAQNELAAVDKLIAESGEDFSKMIMPQVEAAVAGTVTSVNRNKAVKPSNMQELLVAQQELQQELQSVDAELQNLNDNVLPEWERTLRAAEDQYKENQMRVMAALPEGLSAVQEGIRAVPAVLGETVLSVGVGGGVAKAGQALVKAAPNVYGSIAKAATLGAMTTNAVSRSSAEAIVEGLDTNSAFLKGAIDGGIELVTEAVPVGKLFSLYRKGGDSAIKEYVELVAAETVGENVAELAGTVNSLAFGMEEELAQAIEEHGLLSTEVLQVQARKQIVASVAGSLNAAVLGAPALLAPSSESRQTQEPEEASAEVESTVLPDGVEKPSPNLVEAQEQAAKEDAESTEVKKVLQRTNAEHLARIRSKDEADADRLEGIEAVLESPDVPAAVKSKLSDERADLLDRYNEEAALDLDPNVAYQITDKKAVAAVDKLVEGRSLPAEETTKLREMLRDEEGAVKLNAHSFKTLVQDSVAKPELTKPLEQLANSPALPDQAKDFIRKAMSPVNEDFLDVSSKKYKNFLTTTVQNAAVTVAAKGAETSLVLSKIGPQTLTNMFPANYAVVEAEDLALSIDGVALDSAPEGAANFFENYSSKTPEGGAPVFAENGTYALGSGAGRAASVIKSYRKGTGGQYRKALIENASSVGLSGEAVDQIANPVLIRTVKDADTTALVKEQSKVLYDADFNADAAVEASREAVSAALEQEVESHLVEARAVLEKRLGKKFADLIRFTEDPSMINQAKALDTEGMFFKDTGAIYLFPSVIKPQTALDSSGQSVELLSETDRLLWVAHHELFHRGFALYDSRKYQKVLYGAGKNRKVRELAQQIKALYADKNLPPLPDYVAVEEALAELSAAHQMRDASFIKSHYGVSVKIDATITTLLEKLAAVIRDILRKLTGRDVLLTDAQLFELLRDINAENTEATVHSSMYSLSPSESKDARIKREFDEVEALVGGYEAYRKADSFLTYKQWVQVRTPSFKAWFGDWENNADAASKVVDPDTGEPRVVFHGTTQEFNTFDMAKANPDSFLGRGFYFSSSNEDSLNNYADISSPDLNNKIEHLSVKLSAGAATELDLGAIDVPQDKLDSVIGDMTGSLELATEILYGNKSDVKNIFLNLRNPLTYNGANATVFKLEEDPEDLYTKFRDEFLEDPDLDPSDIDDLVWEEMGNYDNPLVGPNGENFLDGLHRAAQEFDVDYWALEAGIQVELDLLGGSQVEVHAEDLFEAVRSRDEVLNAYNKDGGSIADFLRAAAQYAGFDGFVMDASETSRKSWNMDMDHDVDHYIALDALDIKSAEENSGAFDPANPDIRFSTTPRPTKVRDVGAKRVKPTKKDSGIRNFAHRTLFNDAVLLEKAGLMNPEGRALEIQFDNYSSIATRRIEKEVAPLRDQLIESLSDTYRLFKKNARYVDLGRKGLDQFVEDFFKIGAAVYHGEERNTHIAVTSKGEVLSGSGYTFAEINEIKNYYETEVPGLVEAYEGVYASSVKPLLDFSDNTLKDAGLLTDSMVAKQPNYDWYVPLYGRGDSSDVFGDVSSSKPPTLSGLWKNLNPSAKGRETVSDNIFDNLVYKVERSVHRSEMQTVKQHLLDFVSTKEGESLLKAKVNQGSTSALAASKENEVIYFKDGTVTVIEINNQEALDLFTPVFSRLNDSQTITEAVLNTASGASRFVGSFFTRFSPAFLAVTKIKDTISATLFLAMRPRTDVPTSSYLGASANVAKNATIAARANWNNLWMTSAMGKSNYLAAKKNMWLDRYLELGGGFTQANYFGKDHMVDFMHELRKRNLSSGGARTLAVEGKNQVRDAMDSFGDHLELTTRVAVFKALVESGVPDKESAQFAKNIMNYNTKGSASRFLAAFNPFYSTALYDFKRTTQSMIFRKEGHLVFTALVAFKLAQLYMLSHLSGEDEDGAKYIDKFAVSDMGNALMVPYGDSRWAFRIPNGFGMDALAAVTATNIRRAAVGVADPVEAFRSTFTDGVMGELFPIRVSATDPENRLKGVMDILTPYAIKPLMDLSRNLKYNGRPLHRDPDFLRQGDLQSDSGYYYTHEKYKKAAALIFKITGADVFPETLQHLDRSYLGSYTGTVLSGFTQLAGVKYEQDNDKILPEALKGVPIVKSFVQHPYSTDSDNYRGYKKAFNDDLARTLKARENGAELDVKHSEQLLLWAGIFKESERALRGLNKDIKAVQQTSGLSRTEKNNILEGLNEQKRLLQMDVNSAYAKSMK